MGEFKNAVDPHQREKFFKVNGLYLRHGLLSPQSSSLQMKVC